jgi:hypothetical protein
MDLDEAVKNLIEENNMIKDFLEKYVKDIKDKKLIQDADVLVGQKDFDYNLSSLDELNQMYRGLLVRAQTHFEKEQNLLALKDSWKILRIMHGHRKVSHLLTLLRG